MLSTYHMMDIRNRQIDKLQQISTSKCSSVWFWISIYMSDACSNTLLQVSAPKHGTGNIAYKEQSVSPLSPQQNDKQYRCNYINLRHVLHTGILGNENLSPHQRRFKGCYKNSQFGGWRSNHMYTFMFITTPNLFMTFDQWNLATEM